MINIQELELVEFFEVKPYCEDSDVSWPYNHFIYEITSGDILLRFTIDPADQDIDLVLMRNAVSLYELSAEDIHDVKVLKDNNRRTLEIVLDSHNRVLLRLKPSISIVHLAPRNV